MGSDALPSWTEAQSTNMSTTAPSCQILASAHNIREEKVKLFKVNQKEEKLTVSPRQRCQKFVRANLCIEKYKI